MVNGDEADAVLQSVLLWTCARLFDWVITLFRDALACDEQEESNFYHSSMVYHKWNHQTYGDSFECIFTIPVHVYKQSH